MCHQHHPPVDLDGNQYPRYYLSVSPSTRYVAQRRISLIILRCCQRIPTSDESTTLRQGPMPTPASGPPSKSPSVSSLPVSPPHSPVLHILISHPLSTTNETPMRSCHTFAHSKPPLSPADAEMDKFERIILSGEPQGRIDKGVILNTTSVTLSISERRRRRTRGRVLRWRGRGRMVTKRRWKGELW